MKPSYLKTQIIRTARNSLIVQLIIIVAVACIGYFGVLSSNLAILANPNTEASQIEDLEQGKIVNFVTPMVYNLGHDYVENGVKGGAYGLAVFNDGGMVVVKFSGKDASLIDQESVRIKGMVNSPTSYERDMINEYIDEWVAESDDDVDAETLRSWFAEYRIDYNYDFMTLKIIAYLMIGFIAVMLVLAVKNIRRIQDYKLTKVYQAIGATEFDEVERQLDADRDLGAFLAPNKRSMITKSHVAMFGGAKDAVKSTKDLVWAYKNMIKHYTNGIPSGKTFEVKLAFVDGAAIAFGLKNEKKVDEFLEKLGAMHPQVIRGYSKELAAVFKQDPRTFLAASANLLSPEAISQDETKRS